MNHEYAGDGLLHADGMATWNATKVRKAQAAHGVSVVEVESKANTWQVVRPSPWARRITASTPDGRTMLINVQHPGESPSERSDPANPRRFSHWPDQRANGRLRSATVVIRKNDGGVIGT